MKRSDALSNAFFLLQYIRYAIGTCIRSRTVSMFIGSENKIGGNNIA